MKKLKIPVIFITIFLFGVLGLAKSSLAAVSLPWSTTYNCPDWNTITDPLNCDGLSPAGGWTCGTGGANLYEQITSDANFPSGGGGKGQRHWKGDGNDVNSGGISLGFNTPQPELWIRWYMRYESGFQWANLGYDKWLYIHTGKSGTDCIPEFYYGAIRLTNQGGTGNPPVSNVPQDWGWPQIMGDWIADGLFHCYEIHIKMDTNSSNGIGEFWSDGVKRLSVTNVGWSGGDSTARQGWTGFLIGSNQNSPDNGKCMYVDFDDIAVSTTGYIGPISAPDTIPPSVPENLTAVPVSSSQINLSWNASVDNAGVTGYSIYRDGNLVGNLSTNSYSDTGLSSLTTYTYQVSAYDAAGNRGNLSNSVLATTLPSSNGNIYYVDQNHLQASDSNPGTEVLPWLTMIHGCEQVQAGDTLYVKNGTYATKKRNDNEDLPWTEGWMIPGIWVKHSGTESQPIIIKAYPGHTPIIDGTTANHSTIGTYKSDWIIFDGFKVVKGMFYINGEPPDFAEHVTIQNCDVQYGFRNPSDVSHTNQIEGRYAKYLTIRNNKIYDQYDWAPSKGTNAVAIIFYWVDYALVENNYFNNNYMHYRNKAGNNGQYGKENIFRYNLVKNGYCGVYMGGYDGASTDNEIYQNIFIDNDHGVSMDIGNRGTLIYNNVFYNSPGYQEKVDHTSPIGYGFTTDLADNEVYNNIVAGFYYAGSFSYGEPTNLYYNYNAYYNYNYFLWSWTIKSFGEWQALLSDEANSLNGQDPKFVNPAADFHLQSNSPCINSGIDRQDYDNDGNKAEGINMGAYITGNEIIGMILPGTQPVCGDSACNTNETCLSCPEDCTCHRSDTNQDGCVEMNELTSFIDRWKVNNLDVTMPDMMGAIGLWKRGC